MNTTVMVDGARVASEVEIGFPWLMTTVAFILIMPDGSVRCNPYGRDGLRSFVAEARAGATLLAVWPGCYRSDTFVVDDLDLMEYNIPWLTR